MPSIPTKEQIDEEANNYGNLSFFKKTKNALVAFILVISALSLFFIGNIEAAFGSGAIYELGFNVVLAAFIYFNHRWAMIVFCFIYIIDKVLFILGGFGSPVSQIIFAAIAIMLTYTSFRVATALKRKAAEAQVA